jgi:predicted HicB family RNase H-like nuclease
MNTMDYKGYSARIQYSDEDEVLFGAILGINDLVTFEGNSIEEMKKSFHDAVDDYLDMCSRYNKKPEKAYKGCFNVRISPELHKKAALKASLMEISLNQYTEIAIQKSVNEDFGIVK